MDPKTTNWLNKVKQTREKRLSQSCKVYELKFDKSHLSKCQKKHLRMLFIEAKWLYNYILSSGNIKDFNTKVVNITSLDKDRNIVDRSLRYLSAQMKQSIKERIVYALKSLKVKGTKGTLRCKSVVDVVNLRQFDKDYKFTKAGKYVRLQNIKKPFKLLGHNQISHEAEFANAILMHRNSDYYLKVTTFSSKIEEKQFKEQSVGIDFGLKDSVVLSNGEKFKIYIPESQKLKTLQKKFKNKVKYSKNWNKNKLQVAKQYNKITNQKKDFKNKLVSYITNTFATVCVQDENIKGWQHGRFGKSVQHSCLGGIMRDLKRKSHTLKLVNRSFPSTQLCPKCGMKNKLGLENRVYVCKCGYWMDRDTHSANNILCEGLQIPTERRDFKPVEIEFNTVLSEHSKIRSLKQEAHRICG